MADEMVPVAELVAGDMINLQGDPFADPGHGPGEHMHTCMWQYEPAVVGGEDGAGELETPDCYRLDFVHMDGASSQGFPPVHLVRRVGHDAPPSRWRGIRDGQWRLRWQLQQQSRTVGAFELGPDWASRLTQRPPNLDQVQRYLDGMASPDEE